MSDTEREAVARDSLPIMSDSARGFAAMFRAGAYDPDDAEMVAKKFEELGAALDAHDAERGGGMRRGRWLRWRTLAAKRRAGSGLPPNLATNLTGNAISTPHASRLRWRRNERDARVL